MLDLIYVDRGQHLVYSLNHPDKTGEVQAALNISTEGAYVINIKNPDKSAPENADLPEDRKADYPNELMEVFRNRRFADEDPRLLDYEGAQFVMVGAHRHPEDAYGVNLPKNVSDAVQRLRLSKEKCPTEPLKQGEWA